MWTKWLERTLRPRGREVETVAAEVAHAATTTVRDAAHSRRSGDPGSDVNLSTSERMEQSCGC